AFGFWQSLWILFAGANQLLAALILLLISAWLVKSEKSYLWTLIPSLALFVTALGALIYSVFYQELYQRFFLDQLNAPELTAGIFITIIFGLFFMIFGTYLYFAGLKKLNSSWTIRF
ncbi:MAG: carbon starvation CstA family protein, partial [Anaerolineales bacterium]